MGPKKSRGFLDAAGRLIAEHPGLTSKEIATQLLDSGEVTSYAHNPEGSLIATLQKHYLDINVGRRKEGGIFRFYPNGITVFLDPGETQSYAQNTGRSLTATPDGTTVAEDPGNNNQPSQPLGTDEVEITVRLPRVIVDIIDNAVASGRYKQRNLAIQRLLQKGLGAGA